MFEIPRVWAGTQESLDLVLEAAKAEVGAAAARGRDPFELQPLLAEQDGVGIISISGPLVTGYASPFARLFGNVLGYGDIQEAFAEAAETSKIKSILAVYSSGGGAVAGADDTSAFISKVSKAKPVVSYAAGTMASAALWLGSAGRKRLGSSTSIVGSIGVMAVFIDRSAMLEKEGIKAYVFRSGKYKGLATGLEPLAKLAQEEMQAQVDDLNDIFEARIAANYGVSTKQVRDRMGQGREFLGAKAVEVGLLDGVSTLEESFAVAKMLGRS